jgi:ADP-heptose:LPS heptosyltransferase
VRDRSADAILIFRLGSIGDTVVALPCFHAIARRFPNSRRCLLTNSLTSVRASSAESILDGTGLVDEVLYYPVGDFSLGSLLALRREIRRLRPRTLVYLAERPGALPVLRDAAFFATMGLSNIIGLPWRADLRRCRREPSGVLEYEYRRLARTLAPAIAVSFTTRDWDMHLRSEESAKADAALASLPTLAVGSPAPARIAIAPGAKVAAKDWGESRWTELVRALAPRYAGTALILIGAADERDLCARVAQNWRGPVLNIAGSFSPRETAAILGRCDFLVCHDSGPMHIAATQRTACVALFGDYNLPCKWYPYGEQHSVIYEPRGVREIPVARVVASIDARLSTPATPNPSLSGPSFSRLST